MRLSESWDIISRSSHIVLIVAGTLAVLASSRYGFIRLREFATHCWRAAGSVCVSAGCMIAGSRNAKRIRAIADAVALI